MNATSRQPSPRYPTVRRENIVCEEVLDEFVVYDLERHQAHSLNPTAAAVWRLCDGATSPDAMAERLAEELDVPAAAAEPIVWLALDRLETAHLMEAGDRPAHKPSLTRRDVMRKLAIAGLAAGLPVVYTLVAPPVHVAASGTGVTIDRGLDTDSFCLQDKDCPSGYVCIGGKCTTGK